MDTDTGRAWTLAIGLGDWHTGGHSHVACRVYCGEIPVDTDTGRAWTLAIGLGDWHTGGHSHVACRVYCEYPMGRLLYVSGRHRVGGS